MQSGRLFASTLVASLPLAAGPMEDWAKMQAMVPRGYECLRATAPVKIDGRLDEAAWKAAPWTDEFVDIRGAAFPKPWHPTRAKMLWDDTYFYLAAELTEDHVWGTLRERDSVIFQDNDFEVFIDPDADSHEYYEFEMNALNTVWDLRLVKAYKDGGPALNEWNIAGLKTGVHVEGTLNQSQDRDQFWSVEIAMPWKALAEYSTVAAPPKNGDRWRVDFSRVEWKTEIVDGQYRKVPNRPEENWVWSPTGIVDMHRPERWGIVQFSTATRLSPTPVPVRPGPLEAVRDRLQEVYYRQRAFQESHKRFAKDRLELGLPAGWYPNVTVEATATGYQTSSPVESGDRTNSKTKAHLREDGRFWQTR